MAERSWLLKTAKQRYTLGVVYEPDTLDTDGEYASAAVIQRACWGFLAKLQGRAEASKRALTLTRSLVKALSEVTDGVRLDITELVEDVAKGRLGDQHSSWDDNLGEIVESYVAPCDITIEGEIVKAGTWLMGVVWSPEQFAKIEAGERTGLSMGGVGRTEYREALEHAA